MSILPKWEKQIFLGEVSFQLFFPLNSFSSVNLPLVCRLCRQTKLFSCKYFSIFPLHFPARLTYLCLLCTDSGCCDRQGYEGVRRSLVSNPSTIRAEPHEAILACVGELALR